MKTHAQSFDYIVVGAGSAGCVLANRLTAGQLCFEHAGTENRVEAREPSTSSSKRA